MEPRVRKGTYLLEERKLRLHVADDLEFGERQAYYLCGNNGLGKTSFLERVLIPALERDTVSYLYLGQDLGVQIYTMKASLAVSGLGLGDVGGDGLIRLWIREGRDARAFLLDEFDKYYPEPRFVFEQSADFVRTFVFVSHQDICRLLPLDESFERYRLSFEFIGLDGEVKNVRVDKSRL